MNNILTFNHRVDKRIADWSNYLRHNNMNLVATVAVGSNQELYVMLSDDYSQNEVHFLLEQALSQIEENVNMEMEHANGNSITRLDIN
jgi:hypothetical protein